MRGARRAAPHTSGRNASSRGGLAHDPHRPQSTAHSVSTHTVQQPAVMPGAFNFPPPPNHLPDTFRNQQYRPNPSAPPRNVPPQQAVPSHYQQPPSPYVAQEPSRPPRVHNEAVSAPQYAVPSPQVPYVRGSTVNHPSQDLHPNTLSPMPGANHVNPAPAKSSTLGAGVPARTTQQTESHSEIAAKRHGRGTKILGLATAGLTALGSKLGDKLLDKGFDTGIDALFGHHDSGDTGSGESMWAEIGLNRLS